MSIFRKRDIIKKEPEYAIKTVIKRDGSKEDFNVEKIKSAIYKAFNASELYNHGDFINFFEKFDKNVLLCIPDSELSVEDIQDIIERSLMSLDYFDVAKKYIIYRERHKVSREENKKLIAKIADKLEGKDIKNQNANVDERSFGGRLGEATRVVTKDYALKYCMSEMARNNHLNNEIYIHDLDSYAIGEHNCLSMPIDDLLANGFTTRQTDVRPAGSVNTALQLVAVLFQIQSLQQFGGVAATHLDWTMVPYVRKSFYKHYMDWVNYAIKPKDPITIDVANTSITDRKAYKYQAAFKYAMDMTIREVHQAVEGLYHNLKNKFGHYDSNIIVNLA